MAYYAHVPIDLGSDGDSKTLTANLYPTDSATATEEDVGTVTEIGGGMYIWEYDSVPEGFNGCVVFLESTTPQAMEKLTAPDDSVKYLIHALHGTTPENVIYVAASGGNDSNAGTDPRRPKATLASALSASSSGDTVLCLQGSHTLSGSGAKTIPAGVTVKGLGMHKTTIVISNVNGYIVPSNLSHTEDVNIDATASLIGGIVPSNASPASTFSLRRVKITADTYALWLNAGTGKQICHAWDCEFYGGIGGANISSQSATTFHELHLHNCISEGNDALQVLVSDAVSYGSIVVRGRMFAHDCTFRGFHSDENQVTGGILCGDPPGLTDRGDGQAWLRGCTIESKHSHANGVFWDLRARLAGSEIYFEDCAFNAWSIEQESGGRVFSTLLNAHDKISILQGGTKIWYANPDEDYSSSSPKGRGFYVRDGFDTIQAAIDESLYGDTVYAMPGHEGEQFEITGSITMADGVELHGLGIDRTKITYTGTGEGDSVTNPALVLAGTNRVEDLSIVDSTTNGVGGIVHPSGAGTIVLDHVKVTSKQSAITFSSTTAIAAAVENCTVKAGQYALNVEDAAHTVYLAGDHQLFDARESYGDGSMDLAALRVRNGAGVYGEAWLNALHSDAATNVHGVDAGAGCRVVLAGAIKTSNTGDEDLAIDIDSDGAACVVSVAGCNYQQSKVVTANGGRVLDDASHTLAASDVAIDKSPTPWQVVNIERGTGVLGSGTEILRQDLKDPDDGNVTAETTRVGRQVTPS